MNVVGYKYHIGQDADRQVFHLVNEIGLCVGKILFTSVKGKRGNIYKIPLLGTANGGGELSAVNLEGIEKLGEKVPGLLYIMFQIFFEYIKSIDKEGFSVNIENPLLTLIPVYKKLIRFLTVESLIDSGVVQSNIVITRCD